MYSKIYTTALGSAHFFFVSLFSLDRDAYSEEEEDEEPTDPKKSDEVSPIIELSLSSHLQLLNIFDG